MSDPEHDEVEITSGFVWRDTALSVSLLIGAYVVELFKSFLFPRGVPFATDVALTLGELAMVILSLRHAARVSVWLLPRYEDPHERYIGKILSAGEKITPAGWGIICGLIFLAVSAFSLIVTGAPKWVYVILWLFAALFWIGATAGAGRVEIMGLKLSVTFVTVTGVLTFLIFMLISVAYILNMGFGGDITAKSIIEWILSRGAM